MERVKQLLILCCLLTSIGCAKYTYAQTLSIEFFKGSWEQALAKAEEEQKVIFVKSYTDWCGPCKVMDKDVFSDQALGAYFNEHFVNLSMNVGEGQGAAAKAFQKKYGVNMVPDILFINAQGEVLDRTHGIKHIGEVERMAKKVISDHIFIVNTNKACPVNPEEETSYTRSKQKTQDEKDDALLAALAVAEKQEAKPLSIQERLAKYEITFEQKNSSQKSTATASKQQSIQPVNAKLDVAEKVRKNRKAVRVPSLLNAKMSTLVLASHSFSIPEHFPQRAVVSEKDFNDLIASNLEADKDLFKKEKPLSAPAQLVSATSKRSGRPSVDVPIVFVSADAKMPTTKTAKKDFKRTELRRLQAAYDKGNREASFLYAFAYELKKYELPAADAVNKYINAINVKGGMKTKKNTQFIFDFSGDLHTHAMDVLLRDIKHYEGVYGVNAVEQHIAKSLKETAVQAAEKKDQELLKRTLALADKTNCSDKARLKFELAYTYHEQKGEKTDQLKLLRKYMKQNPNLQNPDALVCMSRRMMQLGSKKADLITARKWASVAMTARGSAKDQRCYMDIDHALKSKP